MPKNDIKGYDILVALILLTRLPLPRLPSKAFERQSRSTWSFPLVGAIITLPLCLLAVGALALGLSAPLTATFFLTGQILLTGAMHEDGLADTADGFWGGFTQERRLEIMKDSHIGTYGVIALAISLALRGISYALLFDSGVIWQIVIIAMMSRTTMTALMWHLPHARSNGLSQSVGRPSGFYCLFACALALIPALFTLPIAAVVGLVAAAIVPTCLLGQLAKHKIHGQTGDILGASQQLSEIALLITLTLSL